MKDGVKITIASYTNLVGVKVLVPDNVKVVFGWKVKVNNNPPTKPQLTASR
jgi:hypothetical protein